MHLILIVYPQSIVKIISNLRFVLRKTVPVYHDYLMFRICLLWVIHLIINVYLHILIHFWLKLKIFIQQPMVLNIIKLISFLFSSVLFVSFFFFLHLYDAKQHVYISSRTIEFIVQKEKKTHTITTTISFFLSRLIICFKYEIFGV
jgi:hypothetical protein